MEWNITPGAGTITQLDIESLNKKLDFKLPEEYEKFLLEKNCVIPSKKYFNFINSNNEKLYVKFKYFLGINYKESIFNIFSRYVTISDNIPSDLFPIADTGSSSIICMGYKGENKGKIFICSLGDVVSSVSYEDGTASKIADSLGEVLSNLVESP